MGGGQSKQEPATPDLNTVLKENTYFAGKGSKFPYFLVQLSEDDELEYKGALVSDAIVEYIREHDISHIIAQTHGWNTPPQKAVAQPFTEFIGGMQNDAAMPKADEFKPIFVAFIWPALPYTFCKEDDALTRAELISENEKELAGGDTDISKAADAAKVAIQEQNPDKEDLINELKVLAGNQKSPDDDDDDDEDPEAKVLRIKAEASKDDTEDLDDRIADIARAVLRPLETLAFGRLMSRGQKTGKVMEKVLGKLMAAHEEARTKVCLMANSLGAHVLAGILKNPTHMPYKVHTVFFVQGAITRDLFAPGAKYASVPQNVAGPIVCTFSDRDLMLKRIYQFFHGIAIGIGGVPVGKDLFMKSLDELKEEPYCLECGDWNSVNGTRFIDEGNAVAGGHGDFKEDETTSLYWAAIRTFVEPAEYDR